MQRVIARSPGETEFHQAVREVAADIVPFIAANPVYEEAKILERMTEPDRVVSFRVSWADDSGEVQVNRGYRIQANNAIGPAGWAAVPSVGISVDPEVPGLRADLQELADRPSHGRRQGRRRLRSERQV